MFQLNYIYKARNNNRCFIAGQRRESECAIYQLVYLFTYINAIPFKIFNENKLKGTICKHLIKNKLVLLVAWFSIGENDNCLVDWP